MEWAEALVAAHLEPQPLSHSLDGEGSEFLNVESVHKGSKGYKFQVSGFKLQSSFKFQEVLR